MNSDYRASAEATAAISNSRIVLCETMAPHQSKNEVGELKVLHLVFREHSLYSTSSVCLSLPQTVGCSTDLIQLSP